MTLGFALLIPGYVLPENVFGAQLRTWLRRMA
jgi:hypothetical protein